MEKIAGRSGPSQTRKRSNSSPNLKTLPRGPVTNTYVNSNLISLKRATNRLGKTRKSANNLPMFPKESTSIGAIKLSDMIFGERYVFVPTKFSIQISRYLTVFSGIYAKIDKIVGHSPNYTISDLIDFHTGEHLNGTITLGKASVKFLTVYPEMNYSPFYGRVHL